MNKQLLIDTFRSDAGFSALALRIPVGIIFMAHGAQKLFAWFGGYGLEGTGQWMASIGLEPGYLMALLAGSAEFFWRSVFSIRTAYASVVCSTCRDHVGGYICCTFSEWLVYG
jgi:hypothetical protein